MWSVLVEHVFNHVHLLVNLLRVCDVNLPSLIDISRGSIAQHLGVHSGWLLLVSPNRWVLQGQDRNCTEWFHLSVWETSCLQGRTPIDLSHE